MKEQLPSPQFNPAQYERPNDNWNCGKATEGKACRIGPDAKGRCRASRECQPVLETRDGEAKGRWRCTRTAEFGGPCEIGPRPDGTCTRAIPKCVPDRSLRARRRMFTISVAAFTAGVLLVSLCGPFRAKFANPGALSSQHSTEAFAKMAGTGGGAIAGCQACHDTARNGPHGWMAAAFGATPGPFNLRALAATGPPTMNAIDQSCEHCHKAHSFHEPNVARDHSCSACHQEHRGPGPMAAPTDANCLSCHAKAAVLQTSYEKGKMLPPEEFDYRPDQGRVLFKAPRPQRGYTKVIRAFAIDHPEFQVLADKLKDPDTLKFNHALHLSSPNILAPPGRKLACHDCHKPDAAGVLHLKITYEENCKSCHSLQFDVNNPELRVPHGNAEHVRAFLRSLPAPYADFGARVKGLSGRRELDDFVQQQMRLLRSQYASGEELERRVFFSEARTGPISKVAGLGGLGAARFPGCAYCHPVAAVTEGAPEVSQPVIADRWFVRGAFNHSKHFKVDCVQCHDATQSRETSDVLLPAKASCVECHSPQGGVASNCSECHSYHTPRKQTTVAAQ
jgi:hypothetical protein